MSSAAPDINDLLGKGKFALAPQVRIGTLGMRALCLHYGADAVYSEEIIDHKLRRCVRVDRLEDAGFVDYIDPGSGGGGGGGGGGAPAQGAAGAVAVGKKKRRRNSEGANLVFRTCPAEANKVIVQIGTSDAARALEAASLVARDVAAVDVNMGCPESFSLSGGMGAALLQTPERAEDIIKTLRRNLSVPVTCKVRLLVDPRASVEFARRMEAAGACAIGVHLRFPTQRPREPAHHDRMRAICDAVKVPVVMSGDMWSREQALALCEQTGATSAMFARAAMWNPSVFRPEGALPQADMPGIMLRAHVACDTPFVRVKYSLQRMTENESKEYRVQNIVPMMGTNDMADLYSVFGLDWMVRDEKFRRSLSPFSMGALRRALEAEPGEAVAEQAKRARPD